MSHVLISTLVGPQVNLWDWLWLRVGNGRILTAPGDQSNPTYYCKQWNWDDYVIYVFSQNDSEEELDEDFTVSASDLEETLPDG